MMPGTASLLPVTEILAAKPTSATLYCNSGAGACETAQQDLFEPLENCAPPSGWFICSQGGWLVASAHSAFCAEISAQAETGIKPAAMRLKASPRISTLRIEFYYSTLASKMLYKNVRVLHHHTLN